MQDAQSKEASLHCITQKDKSLLQGSNFNRQGPPYKKEAPTRRAKAVAKTETKLEPELIQTQMTQKPMHRDQEWSKTEIKSFDTYPRGRN